MQGFPAEADEAAVLLLMSVVRADQKVLKEEFPHWLRRHR